MHTNVADLFTATTRRVPNKTALIFGNLAFTYAEIDRASTRLAKKLLELGIEAGERVSLYGENCPEWVIGYYAVLKVRAVVNPLNLMLTPSEVAYAVEDCRACTIIGSAEKVSAVSKFLMRMPVRHLIAWGTDCPAGAISFDKCAYGGTSGDESPLTSDGALDDPCTVGYTSGTTGHPKGALLTHRAIIVNVEMTALMHARTGEDVMVASLPFSHVYGNVAMQSVWARGGTAVLHQKFDALATLESIEKHRATLLEGVPTMYIYLLDSPDRSRFDLSSLTRCTVGGQTMPEVRMREVEKAFDCPLIELWGMTELGGLGTTHTVHGPRRLGSIGIALPHTHARIADPILPDSELPRGEVGELQIRGPITMREYIGKAEATAETLIKGGWLRTGDLARIDEDGFIFIVDRLKDMIVTAGFKVYPAEIERVLAEYPGVAMSAVGGVPDATKGELAKAYVVTKPGVELDTNDLDRHCRQHLAAYKVPRYFQVVSDLPKTSSGKIMRRALATLDDGSQRGQWSVGGSRS